MAFIVEFMEHFIRSHMEDPKERYEKWTNHVRTARAKADDLVETWALPTKPYGYWNTDKNNAKYLLDLRFNRVSGRENPWAVAERRQREE